MNLNETIPSIPPSHSLPSIPPSHPPHPSPPPPFPHKKREQSLNRIQQFPLLSPFSNQTHKVQKQNKGLFPSICYQFPPNVLSTTPPSPPIQKKERFGSTAHSSQAKIANKSAQSDETRKPTNRHSNNTTLFALHSIPFPTSPPPKKKPKARKVDRNAW